MKNFEHFLMEILNIGNEKEGLLGGIILNENSDGNPKTYTKENKTLIEVIDKFPLSLLIRGQSGYYPLIPKLARFVFGSNFAKKE